MKRNMNAEYLAEYRRDKACVRANRKYWFIIWCIALFLGGVGWLFLQSIDFQYVGKNTKPMYSNVDGLGFKYMMELTSETQDLSDQFMRDIAFNGMSFTDDKISEWKKLLEDYTYKLSKLKYDQSYKEFVMAHTRILELQTELISKMKNQESESSKNKTYQEIASFRRTTKDLLISAMDKNGVDYWYENGILKYNYRYY